MDLRYSFEQYSSALPISNPFSHQYRDFPPNSNPDPPPISASPQVPVYNHHDHLPPPPPPNFNVNNNTPDNFPSTESILADSARSKLRTCLEPAYASERVSAWLFSEKDYPYLENGPPLSAQTFQSSLAVRLSHRIERDSSPLMYLMMKINANRKQSGTSSSGKDNDPLDKHCVDVMADMLLTPALFDDDTYLLGYVMTVPVYINPEACVPSFPVPDAMKRNPHGNGRFVYNRVTKQMLCVMSSVSPSLSLIFSMNLSMNSDGSHGRQRYVFGVANEHYEFPALPTHPFIVFSNIEYSLSPHTDMQNENLFFSNRPQQNINVNEQQQPRTTTTNKQQQTTPPRPPQQQKQQQQQDTDRAMTDRDQQLQPQPRPELPTPSSTPIPTSTPPFVQSTNDSVFASGELYTRGADADADASGGLLEFFNTQANTAIQINGGDISQALSTMNTQYPTLSQDFSIGPALEGMDTSMALSSLFGFGNGHGNGAGMNVSSEAIPTCIPSNTPTPTTKFNDIITTNPCAPAASPCATEADAEADVAVDTSFPPSPPMQSPLLSDSCVDAINPPELSSTTATTTSATPSDDGKCSGTMTGTGSGDDKSIGTNNSEETKKKTYFNEEVTAITEALAELRMNMSGKYYSSNFKRDVLDVRTGEMRERLTGKMVSEATTSSVKAQLIEYAARCYFAASIGTVMGGERIRVHSSPPGILPTFRFNWQSFQMSTTCPPMLPPAMMISTQRQPQAGQQEQAVPLLPKDHSTNKNDALSQHSSREIHRNGHVNIISSNIDIDVRVPIRKQHQQPMDEQRVRELKLEEKRRRNRESAARSNLKRKLREQQQYAELETLKARVVVLRERRKELAEENSRLRQAVR